MGKIFNLCLLSSLVVRHKHDNSHSIVAVLKHKKRYVIGTGTYKKAGKIHFDICLN